MKTLRQTWGSYLRDKNFLSSFLFSFLLLVASLVANFYAGLYATASASNSVTDIILSNIRAYDVDAIFIYGPWILWIFVALLVVTKPNRIPFIVKSIALFEIIRCVFISLTHIGPFPTAITITSSRLISDFAFGGDLFFSAHTGLPFLMALVFWKNKMLGWIFVLTSVFFGAVVLLGHLHYSIDVFSAFFITYTIYHMAEVLFKKDKTMFDSGIQEAL